MDQLYIYLIIGISGALVAIFAIVYFSVKINALKKEKSALASLLEKNEKKFETSEIIKNRISKIIFDLNEGIIVLDEKHKIFVANSAARKILDIKTRDVHGMHLSELSLFKDLKPVTPYFSAPRDISEKEIELKNSTIKLSVSKLELEGGNAGKLIVLRDVTKDRSLEKAKTDFMLSTVHQIKTAMSSLKWLIKMFLDGDFGKLNKEQKVVMKKLYDRNESLFSSIEDLLEKTKIDEGAYIYNKTSVDIQELVQDTVSFFKDKIKSKKIKFEFKKPSQKMPRLVLDKDKVESVLQNLFDNALKYTAAGGSVKVSLENNGQEVEFRIKDSGIGIPESQQAKIFGRFFRAENANKIEKDGSGLGLFIVKKIIEDHNGVVGFESKEGEGSVFYFKLPIA